MATPNLLRTPFEIIIKNQSDEKYRRFRASVINRSLSAIGIPIFVWLIMETFFR